MIMTIVTYVKLLSAILILAFLLMLPPSQAMDENLREKKEPSHSALSRRTNPTLTITIPRNDNVITHLEDVKMYIEELLTGGVAAKSILLTLDVDGTLTNFSKPQESQNIGARGESVAFVKNMVEQGVKLVISSAWPFFEETLERLRNLGFEEILQIPRTGSYNKSDEYILFGDIKVKFCHFGLVASVAYCMDMPLISFRPIPDYYYQKAFAYKFVYPELDEQTITHGVLGDDNSQNVMDFGRDFNRLKEEKGLFNSAQTKLFTLSPARGEPYLR